MAAPSLRSAARLHAAQQRLITIGVAQARQTWLTKAFSIFAAILGGLQHEAAINGVTAAEAMIQELEIDAPPVAAVDTVQFAGVTSAGADLETFLKAAKSEVDLEMAAITQIMDAARVAEGVSVTSRPAVYGYIRVVNTATCCSRCAVLAGRFYKWSDGFLRHPNCQCSMIPVEIAAGYGIKQTPQELFDNGQIHDLTVAETQAINDGADIGQVVNIRRKAAGLTEAGRVISRLERLTPEGIYHLASDRDEAISLLRRFGYLVSR